MARVPVALAATVHDPAAAFAPMLRRQGPALAGTFAALGILATDATAPEVVAVLTDLLGAQVGRAPADGRVGAHRREAVRLAGAADTVVYSDLDHMLRWLEADRDEVEQVVGGPAADLVVVGRTPAAMAAYPRRLRDTENLINHIHTLATGKDWDLMFAMRLLSGAAVAEIVEHARVDSIAGDVEWPLLVARAGLTTGYVEAEGLSYRVREEFESRRDGQDRDPLRWIERVEIAHLHARVLRHYLSDAQGASAHT